MNSLAAEYIYTSTGSERQGGKVAGCQWATAVMKRRKERNGKREDARVKRECVHHLDKDSLFDLDADAIWASIPCIEREHPIVFLQITVQSSWALKLTRISQLKRINQHGHCIHILMGELGLAERWD